MENTGFKLESRIFYSQLYTLLYKGFCIMTDCAGHK